MALLFVDLLGVRAQWNLGGRAAAQARFAQLEALVVTALSAPNAPSPTHACIESDAVALDFRTGEEAVRFGSELYRLAFSKPRRPSDNRIWLRGAIVDAPIGSSQRNTASVSASLAFVQRTTYTDALLDAIAIEKCGIKGMRLLVADSLLSQATRRAFVQSLGRGNFFPFRRLNHSGYPVQVSRAFSDVLWMASDIAGGWTGTRTQMSSMLRWAAADSEEFNQAAATQLVFNEVDAIVSSLT